MGDPLLAIDDARKLLDGCMAIDRERLGRQVRALAGGGGGRGPTEAQRGQAAQLIGLIERSRARREMRERNLPRPVFDSPGVADLPVVKVREEIGAAIRENQVVVVCGATGSGKTTQLPKICLEVGRGVSGLIGHTQPRRIAARSVAQRIAQELGSSLGGVVGYKVRFTDQSVRAGYIKVMTDGILLAETQGDRLLAQYDTLIIDEAHERSLNIDFLIGYLRQLLARRPDLKLIITSATIDPGSFAGHFRDERTRKPAPIIEVGGRTFPVEVRYRPLKRALTGERGGDEDGMELEMEEAVVEAARELIAGEGAGTGGRDRDILVFLPGEREIRETADELRKAGGEIKRCEIVPLFARLSNEEQNKVFERHDQRRIILATNVAETSLTVPGIKYVIDSGLARISRYSPRVKVQRLPIEPVSRASAQQRSGRCGRTSPGVAIRLYSGDDFEARPGFTDPEILRTNLASVILRMKSLGLLGAGGDVSAFPFLLPPDSRSVRDGYDTLIELGAFDGATGDLTAVGWKLAKLPVDPRIGRMILAAVEERSLAEVLVIGAALSVPDARQRPADKAEQADAVHEKYRDPESDFLSFVKLWREFRKKDRELSGGPFRRWCAAQMLSYVRLREWQEVHRQLTELVGELGLKPDPRPAGYDQVHRALLAGLLSNVGHRGTGTGPGGAGFEYDGVRGLKFSIFPGSALFKERPKWIMAAELVKTTRLYGRTVAKVQPQWIEKAAEHLVGRDYTEPHWMGEAAQVGAYETVTLWGLSIAKRRRVHYGPVDPAVSRAIFIEHALVKGEYLTPGRFFEQNFAEQKKVQKLEEKKRRQDLLADAGARHGFYAQRVPEGVVDGPGFERWRKKAEARQPDLLVMKREDLLAPGAAAPGVDEYPDAIDVDLLGGNAGHRRPVGSVRVPLEYRHKQGDAEDGITATVPAGVLGQIDEGRFEWLVPGAAREKVVELIRSLPKATRVNLAPAPRFADEALKSVVFGEGAFVPAIARALARLSGVAVTPEMFSAGPGTLPEHLRMNFRVVEIDERGSPRVVGSGRDLSIIRSELSNRAATALAALPPGKYNRADVTGWGEELGTLPERVEVQSKGLTLSAFPALVDETAFGEAGRGKWRVGLRVFADAGAAGAAHRRGVQRLLAMQVRKEAASLVEHRPGADRVFVGGAALISPGLARQDVAELVALRAFEAAETGGAVRDPVAFERALNAGWNRLGAMGEEMFGLVEEVFAANQRVQIAVESVPAAWAPTLSDVRHQLALLTGPAAGRVLVDTPYEWLKHVPRYLAAIALRLNKCGGAARVEVAGEGLERDWRQMAQVMPLWVGLVERLRRVGGLAGAGPELVEFRWLLEELRVSLFAQELRTSRTVSVKKLAARWEEMG